MTYSRREFISKLSLGIGSSAIFPGLSVFNSIDSFLSEREIQELPDDKKLGVALVGLGGYATGQLGPALQETKLCKLTGIVTGTPRKEKIWADKYGLTEENIYNYNTYDQIVDNNNIDIIYVVLPNSMHPEYVIRAAEAGKHVISEKPMATSVEDCQRMVDACKHAGRKLSIGYRLHFEPHHKKMMQLGQGEIFGPVQHMEGSHSFPFGNRHTWRLDKQMAGGGPLVDVGIYVIQASIYTMGKLPISVTAKDTTRDPDRFKEVEGTIQWKLNFPDGIVLDGESSYEFGGNHFRMEAADGWAELQPAFSYGGIQGETGNGPMNLPNVTQQALQMDDFAASILNDKPSIVPGEMGKRDVRIIKAIYEAAETGEEIKLHFDPGFIQPVDNK